jgi:hypothetical protein
MINRGWRKCSIRLVLLFAATLTKILFAVSKKFTWAVEPDISAAATGLSEVSFPSFSAVSIVVTASSNRLFLAVFCGEDNWSFFVPVEERSMPGLPAWSGASGTESESIEKSRSCERASPAVSRDETSVRMSSFAFGAAHMTIMENITFHKADA